MSESISLVVASTPPHSPNSPSRLPPNDPTFIPAAAAHRKYEQYTKHVVSLRVILVKMNDDLRLHTDKTPNQTKPNTHLKSMKLGIN